MNHFAQARTNMVDCQIHTAGVVNPVLLSAFETIPKELFVPKELKNIAYCDEEISLGQNRFIVEPIILSKMLEAAAPKKDDVVLDIGGTSGYTSAILSSSASTILMLEDTKDWLENAEKNWQTLEICNTFGVHGPLNKGYAAKAPYDLIVINGAVAQVPESIKQQLAPKGRLICIIKSAGKTMGQATLIQNLGENHFSSYNLFDAGSSYLPGFEPKTGFSF